MYAKYLIRFDDACSTMNLDNWNKIDALCLKYSIFPIIAVIPYNTDPNLFFNSDLGDLFISKIRHWASIGFTISMHGFNHDIKTHRNDNKSLTDINNFSEFVGLSEIFQTQKIRSSAEFFKRLNIKTDIFVPPCHGYDINTINSLVNSFDSPVLYDGFYLFPHKVKNLLILPQQLWKFRPFPFGLWTVCLHPNSMNDLDFKNLEINFIKYKKYITKFECINFYSSLASRSINFLFNKIYTFFVNIKFKSKFSS